MAHKTVRGGSSDIDHGSRDVPAVATGFENWCLVSEYGVLGPDRPILRNVHLQTDLILHHGRDITERIMAVSESVRGCWILR